MTVAITDTRIDGRLAVYGSLRPGGSNHHLLANLPGVWMSGRVHGVLRPGGWASAHGYPGLVLSENAPEVPVEILFSPRLPDLWDDLDAFEGVDYRRVITPALVGSRRYLVNIYELAARHA